MSTQSGKRDSRSTEQATISSQTVEVAPSVPTMRKTKSSTLFSKDSIGSDFKLNVDPDLGMVLDMDVHEEALHDPKPRRTVGEIDLKVLLRDVDDLRPQPKHRSMSSRRGSERRGSSMSSRIGSMTSSISDAFRRHTSFTDVGSQILLTDLEITMNERNNLSTKFCPRIGSCLIWFHQSKWFVIALLIVILVALVTDLWIFTVVLLLGMLSVMDWQYLKYVPRHSFHHLIQQISIIVGAGSRLAIDWDAMRHSDHFAFDLFNHLVRAPIGGMLAIWMIESITGLRTAQWIHCSILMAGILIWVSMLVQMLYEIGQFEGMKDFELLIPGMQSKISMRHMFLAAGFNGLVLLSKKLHFVAIHKDSVMVPEYPVIEWLSDFTESIQESIWSRSQRQRTTTLSLDIYKQVSTQKVELFLDDTNNLLHWMYKCETVKIVEDFYGSKPYNMTLLLMLCCYLISRWFQLWPLVIFAQVIAIIQLHLALCTADIKMAKYYLRSFEFYFKLLNWIMYIVAALAWTVMNEEWVIGESCADHVFLNVIRTLIVLYIICIDAFHISHRTKVITMVTWICAVLYSWICNMMQVHVYDPSKVWQDSEVQIPLLNIQISLRMMLLNSSANFIVFVGKQLALIVLHPGKANIPLYPKVKWIGDAPIR